MKTVELIFKMLAALCLEEHTTHHDSTVSGARFLKPLVCELPEALYLELLQTWPSTHPNHYNKHISPYQVMNHRPLTGKQFLQLHGNFEVLFTKCGYGFQEIHDDGLDFDQFSEGDLAVLLSYLDHEKDGKKVYQLESFATKLLRAKNLTPELFMKYHWAFKHRTGEFQNHNRKTVLLVMQGSEDWKWAVGTKQLTEEDLIPHVEKIADGCYTKDVMQHYSRDFWFKVFEAKMGVPVE